MLSQRPDLGSADSALRLMQTKHSGCDRQIWGSQEGSGDSEVAGAARQRQGLSRLSSVHLMLVSVLRRIALFLHLTPALPLVLGLTGLFPACPRACLAPPFPFVPRKLSSHECIVIYVAGPPPVSLVTVCVNLSQCSKCHQADELELPWDWNSEAESVAVVLLGAWVHWLDFSRETRGQKPVGVTCEVAPPLT